MENLTQTTTINPNYKLDVGEAFSGGLDLFKKDVGGFVVSYLLVMVMSMIPLFGMLGIGNFYKICRKVENGGKAEAGEIFNFDDIAPYLLFMVILMCGMFALILPVEFGMIFSVFMFKENQAAGAVAIVLIIAFVLVLIFAIAAMTSIMYFFIPLVALHGYKDFGKAFGIAWKLFKQNIFNSILLSIVLGFVSSLGILLCGVGIFLTAPLVICMHYVATKNIIVRFEDPILNYEINS